MSDMCWWRSRRAVDGSVEKSQWKKTYKGHYRMFLLRSEHPARSKFSAGFSAHRKRANIAQRTETQKGRKQVCPYATFFPQIRRDNQSDKTDLVPRK
jgi:hypothetical protein